jgi:glycosyltransferase involved in cell wall biosynthesis
MQRQHSAYLIHLDMNTPSDFVQEMRPTSQRKQKSTGTIRYPKIAYIMSRFPKLTETFILYEILAMEALGVETEIYPLLREYQKVTHPEAKRLIPRVHFHPFLSLPILWTQWHFIRRSPVDYFKLWFDVLRWTWGSANFFVGALGIFPKSVHFAYEMLGQGITHIHAHFSNHPTVAALIIHRLTGIPFSFTAHGTDLHVDRRMLDKKIQAAAFAVTISAYNKELMVKECDEVVREKIHVVHCGVDTSVFSPRRKKTEKKPFEILCVATFWEVKGHKYLIEACRLLRNRGMDFICKFVGEGPWRRKGEAQIARADLQDHILLTGGRPRLEVVRMLSEADVVVLPSIPTKSGRREGIPVALMEAMAMGLPVVASAISGIPELVESEHTGLLVPPRDPSALADALQRLIQNREMGHLMGQAGREKVIRRFDLGTNTKQLLRLILAIDGQRGFSEESLGTPATSPSPARRGKDEGRISFPRA